MSVHFTRETGRVAALWPTNALILFALLRSPAVSWGRCLAAGLAGTLAANFVVGDSAATAIQLAACNGVEIGICAGLMRRFAGRDVDLSRQRHLAVFLGAAAFAPLASGLAAGVTLAAKHHDSYLAGFKEWYAADALGLLVVTPALLALTPETMRTLGQALRRDRNWVSILVLGLALAVVFSQNSIPLYFLIASALILVAFQLSVAGAAFALLTTAATGVVMTLTGHGGLILFATSDRLAWLQVFMAIMTMTTLPVAAALETRQRLEGDLREANRLSALAQQISNLGLWRNDFKTGHRTWSDEVFSMHGLTRESFGSRPPQAVELYHPEDQDTLLNTLRRAAVTGEPFDFTLRLNRADDGRERIITYKGEAERDQAGAIAALVGVVRDVTEEETARQRIAASEARYRIIAENVTDVVSRVGLDGDTLYVSPSAADVTGYPMEEQLGDYPASRIHPDDLEAINAQYRLMIEGKRSDRANMTYRTRHRDGRWIWLEVTVALVRDPAGAPVEFIAVGRDVTERMRLEADLRAARQAAEDAAAVKASFLANMSHEIRTPVTSILGFTDLLAGQTKLDAAARGHVARIAGAGRALLSVVNDVLDFSKLEAGQVEILRRPASPTEVLRDALLMFSPQAEAKGLDLDFVGEGLPDCVLIDADRVRQVLLNLIGNAIKFTDSGSVRLVAGYDPKAEQLTVRVEDTGDGMTRAQQKKLFKRFSQVDASSSGRGGTGLGLAISKGLTEAMGGKIGVDSKAGAGSTFYFRIAAPIAEPADLASDAADFTARLDGVRVLVVDDNPMNRELARAVLQPFGAEVFTAEDGRAGVAAAASRPIDVILMDIRMPGLDGPAALAQIRAGKGPNRDAPILAFTADADLGRLGLPSGFDGVVRKPIVAIELAMAVHAAAHSEAGAYPDVEAASV